MRQTLHIPVDHSPILSEANKQHKTSQGYNGSTQWNIILVMMPAVFRQNYKTVGRSAYDFVFVHALANSCCLEAFFQTKWLQNTTNDFQKTIFIEKRYYILKYNLKRDEKDCNQMSVGN